MPRCGVETKLLGRSCDEPTKLCPLVRMLLRRGVKLVNLRGGPGGGVNLRGGPGGGVVSAKICERQKLAGLHPYNR